MVVETADEERVISWPAPNSPISTQGTSIYRQRTRAQLRPGDRVTVRAVPGWLARDQVWTVPARGTAPAATSTLWFALGAALVFGGLCSLALAVPGTTRPHQRAD